LCHETGVLKNPMSKSGVIEPRQLSLLDDPGVSDDERRFADEYIARGFHAGDAYQALGRKANEASASKIARRWLERDSVRAYLQQRLGALASRAELDQDEVVQNARRITAIGLGDLPVRRTLIGKEGVIGDRMIFDPNLSAANVANGLLAKVIGLGDDERERAPVSVSLNFGGAPGPGAEVADG
jgi:hypothetical protein